MSLPEWFSRPFLSKNTTLMVVHMEDEFPVSMKEETCDYIVVEDLLFVLAGVNGHFIFQDSLDGYLSQFIVSAEIRGTIRKAIEKVLPIANNYVFLSTFLEDNSGFEKGVVMHTFCEAVEQLLNDYLILVTQLEKLLMEDDLSLQKIIYYTKPSADCLNLLKILVKEIMEKNVIGGGLINLIKNQAIRLSGYGGAKELFFFLLEQTFSPYGELLQKWLRSGKVNDPYKEFFISKISGDRYEIDVEQTVYLLPDPKQILDAGKYLTILDHCGVKDFPLVEEILFREEDLYYKNIIKRTYNFATSRLFDILIHDYNIVGQLTFIKNALLLQSAEYVNHFFNNSDNLLLQAARDIDVFNAQVLLDHSIQLSSFRSSAYKDNLIGSFLNYDVQTHNLFILGEPAAENDSLIGLESFTVDYKLEWPLNLFIEEEEMEKYKILFRFLFRLHYTEILAGKIWSTRYQFSSDHIYVMRQKMNHFISMLKMYLHTIVIPQHWIQFQNEIKTAVTVDQLKLAHHLFLTNILQDSLIQDENVFKIIESLFVLCQKIYSILQVATPENELFSWVKSTEEKFDGQVRELITQLTSHTTLSPMKFNFCNLINSNDYYKNK